MLHDEAFNAATVLPFRCNADARPLTPSTVLLTVALPGPHKALPMSPGQHIFVALDRGAQAVSRPYTPIDNGGGVFRLAVKAYVGGALSPRLHALQAGDKVGSGDQKPAWGFILASGFFFFLVQLRETEHWLSLAKEGIVMLDEALAPRTALCTTGAGPRAIGQVPRAALGGLGRRCGRHRHNGGA
jgi:hypothetical protein